MRGTPGLLYLKRDPYCSAPCRTPYHCSTSPLGAIMLSSNVFDTLRIVGSCVMMLPNIGKLVTCGSEPVQAEQLWVYDDSLTNQTRYLMAFLAQSVFQRTFRRYSEWC